MDIPLRFNIGAELIERNLRAGRGEAPAIWSGGKTVSYREFAGLTDRLAAALLRAGVEPEQRVLFILPDSPELAAGYLAAMKVGAVAVPCNPLLRTADYIGVLFRSGLVQFSSKEAMVTSDDPIIRQFLAGRARGPIGMDELATEESDIERELVEREDRRLAADGVSDEQANAIMTV